MKSVLYTLKEDGEPRIDLWVDVYLKDDGSKEEFYVLNGNWEGVYCKGSIYIKYTKRSIEGFNVGYFCEDTNTLYKRDEEFNLVAIKEGKSYD